VLGAIPLLGNLFKSRSGSRQKSNLLVFLRPRILRDQAATQQVSTKRYDQIREEERTLHKGKITLLPGERQPSLPAIPASSPNAVNSQAPAAGTPVYVAPSPQPAPAPQPATGAQPAPAPQAAPPLTQPAPPLSQPSTQSQPVPPPPIATSPQAAPAPQPTHSASPQ
jgi:general secretion pathway protein D